MNNIELYDIDDLKKIHEENDNKRNELALIGRQIINRKIEEFLQWLELANIDPTIQSLNEKCLEIKKNKKVVDKSDCVGYNVRVGSVSESLS